MERMIVAHRWVRKEKREHRYRELLGVTYSRQWSEQPYVPGTHMRVWHGVIRCDFSACMATIHRPNGVKHFVGRFEAVEHAQQALDDFIGTETGTSIAQAEANWRQWNREKRAAMKAEREEKARQNVARMTPEARERSRQFAMALGGGPDRLSRRHNG